MGIGGWELHDEEFEWFYGGWAGRTPSDAASFFEGYPGLWWIAGGYAIEALTGPLRQHDDCDPAVLGGEFELPMADALVEVDGIRYLRAEIQLLHKALRVRPKDQADFGACLPLLAEPRRRWLADALVQTLGAEHRWVSLLNQ